MHKRFCQSKDPRKGFLHPKVYGATIVKQRQKSATYPISMWRLHMKTEFHEKWKGKEDPPDIGRRSANKHLKPPLLRNPSAHIRVIIPYGVLVNLNFDMFGLASIQPHFLKRHQFLLWAWEARLLVSHVHLCRFKAGDFSDVAHGQNEFDGLSRRCENLRGQ